MLKCEKTGCEIHVYDRLWFLGHSIFFCAPCLRAWNRHRVTDPVILAIGLDRSCADIVVTRYENGGDVSLSDAKISLRSRESSSLDALNELENWLSEPLEVADE